MSIRQSLSRERDKRTFISLGALTEIVVEDTVKECLRTSGVPVDSQDIRKIVTSCPKWFAILVLLERPYYIVDVLKARLNDAIFPILRIEDLSQIGTAIDQRDIFKVQWIIPPVLDASQHMIFPHDFIPPVREKKCISWGASGLVYKARIAKGHLSDYAGSEEVALKRIDKEDTHTWEVMLREVETLRLRKHPQIIALLASYTQYAFESEVETAALNLIFPLSRMDMRNWLYASSAPLPLELESNRKKYIYDSVCALMSAVSYLHREIDGKATSHHDLKPENILLVGDEWKICDFGTSHLITLAEGSETARPHLGTFTYQPPEYLYDSGEHAKRRHGRAFDIWSMGCIIIELSTILVYGWEPQKIGAFKEMRENNPQKRRQFPSLRQEESSFHNNMNVVEDWMKLLSIEDGSYNLKKTLDIVRSMLQDDPKERPYSWEVEMDFYELLNRSVRQDELNIRLGQLLQSPRLGKDDHPPNPVSRAETRGNYERAKCLVAAGWPEVSKSVSHLAEPRDLASQGATSINSDLEGILDRLFSRNLAYAMVSARNVDNIISDEPAKRGKSSILGVAAAHLDVGYGSFLSENGHPSLQKLPQIKDPVRNDYETLIDADGLTALHRACRFSDWTRIVRIIEHVGPSKAATVRDSNGRLPLHHAAEKGSKVLVTFLLAVLGNLSEDISLRDRNGKTPLHWAARSGNSEVLEVLVCNGTLAPNQYLLVKDDDGNTPLALAIKYQWKETAICLRKLMNN